MAVRLELVVRSSQAQARREVIVRDAAGAIGTCHDAPGIRAVVIDTARQLAGKGLRYVAWVAVNERGAIYPTELVGPAGPLDRAESTVDLALHQVHHLAERPMRLARRHGL